MNSANGQVVFAENVSRRYGEGEAAVDALVDVSTGFDRGRFTAIMGPSGSGKSTLMHILAGLDMPTAGRVLLDGEEITGLDDGELTRLRRDKLGFVFQFFNLLPVLTAEENLVLPLSIAGRKPDAEWLERLIATVGLGDRRTHRPSELSGGQQQRVAVARALVSKPAVVFADEPTGNLDSKASGDVLRLLRQAVDEFGQTVIMVTHDPAAAAHADRLLTLRDGRIVRATDRHGDRLMSADPRPQEPLGAQGAGPGDDLRGRHRRRLRRRLLRPHRHDLRRLRRNLQRVAEGDQRRRHRQEPGRTGKRRSADDSGLAAAAGAADAGREAGLRARSSRRAGSSTPRAKRSATNSRRSSSPRPCPGRSSRSPTSTATGRAGRPKPRSTRRRPNAAGLELGEQLKIVGQGSARSFRLVGLTQLGSASFGGASIAQVTLPEAQRLTHKAAASTRSRSPPRTGSPRRR